MRVTARDMKRGASGERLAGGLSSEKGAAGLTCPLEEAAGQAVRWLMVVAC